MEASEQLARIDVKAAAQRLVGVVRETPLESFDLSSLGGVDPALAERLDLRLKLECKQETGSFKARGAWNQIAQLDPAEREAGVVATSSGNHGRAVAWAANRAGVSATIFMPANAYPNKIQACRDENAEVVLAPTRAEVEGLCAERVGAGAKLIHPYDAARTIEGAGTVGLEIAEGWPEVEICLFPVGGGGLIAGSSLALQIYLGEGVIVIGVEPEGAPNMSAALEAGRPVLIDPITTEVQGLCPLDTGDLNLALVEQHVEGMITVTDEEIFAAQKVLVRAGYTVEPAGAATLAAVLFGGLPEEVLEDRDALDPLRVACVVSGGNPDPKQMAGLL